MKSYNKEKFVYLNISTWVGYGGPAQHYYGNLIGYLNGEYTEKELFFILTEEQAQKLNVKYYNEGDESSRFFSEKDLIKQAKKTFKQHLPNAEVLILGKIYIIEPQTILVGPPNYKRKVNLYAKQCEKLGWWDGENEKEVEKIWDKWIELRSKTFPSSSSR